MVTVHAVGGEGKVGYGGCEGEAAKLGEERIRISVFSVERISVFSGERVDEGTYKASGEAHCCGW